MRTVRSCLVLVLGLLVVAPASGVLAADTKLNPPKNFTLVLGDSLAFGFQQAKFVAGLPDPNPATFNTGFADVFIERLAATPPGKGAEVVNLGCPGETTGSFLFGPCTYNIAFKLHEEYLGTQIEAAEASIAVNPGQVGQILISIGANDVLVLTALCGLDAACIGPLLPGVLGSVGANLDTILNRLRAAAPWAEIILLQYYNPFGFVPGTEVLALSLNAVIDTVAAAHRARVADAFAVFNTDVATLCALTLMCPGGIPSLSGDIHASDAGYAVIADLMFQAAGYTRFEH